MTDEEFGDGVPSGIVLAQASLPRKPSEAWLVHLGRALPLAAWAGSAPCAEFGSVTGLVRHWGAHHAELRQLLELPQTVAAIADEGVRVDSLELESPLDPGQLFCTIGNYSRQVIEAAVDAAGPAEARKAAAAAKDAVELRRHEGTPYVCLTSVDRTAGPTGELVLEPDVETLDWEVEIAAVIGAPGSRLTPAEAGEAIAGYCLANDLTIRSRVIRPDLPSLGSDWIQCKGLQGSLPLGPWFVPAWQIPDPSRLRLRLLLNDVPMQDDTADDMIFSVPQQLSYLSQHTRLHPGDLLCTGSPAGFGSHHGRFLRPGDVLKASASGLGQQIIRCVDPQALQADPAHAEPLRVGPRTRSMDQ